MHGEIYNFFKYNKECEHPLEEDMILDLLNSPEHREEEKFGLILILKDGRS